MSKIRQNLVNWFDLTVTYFMGLGLRAVEMDTAFIPSEYKE